MLDNYVIKKLKSGEMRRICNQIIDVNDPDAQFSMTKRKQLVFFHGKCAITQFNEWKEEV